MIKFSTVTLEKQNHIAILTLNRPKHLNAINETMIEEINIALDAVEADSQAHVLVVHGAGTAFCTGFDPSESDQSHDFDVAYWQPLLERQFNLAMRFWHLTKPTIAAVHHYCLSLGCEIALACDVTVAAEDTRLGDPELKFGGGILVLLMPWLTGPKRAKELLLTGNDRIDAQQALELGLVNHVVPVGQQLQSALEIAKTIATLDSQAVRLTKRAINRTYEIMGMRDALASGLDTDVLIESLATPRRRMYKEFTRQEGLEAALKWRQGQFLQSNTTSGN